MRILLVCCWVLVVCPLRVLASIDGSLLSDWKIDVKTGDRSTADINAPYLGSGTFVEDNGSANKYGKTTYGTGGAVAGLLGAMIEDSRDNSANGTYLLEPNHGGQNYDAEFLGVAYHPATDKLVIAILTGQRPDNGYEAPGNATNPQGRYSPGDIMIVTDVGVFGIEVGGGKPNSGATQINLGDPGTTYKLDTNGFTRGGRNSDGTSFDNPNGLATMDSTQTAGSVWLTAMDNPTDWIFDPIANPFTPTQFQIGRGTRRGDATQFIYKFDASLGQHAVIEVELDWSDIFGAGTRLNSVAWAPSCGNDLLSVTIDGSPQPIPEASSMAVWGVLIAGALGIGWHRRRDGFRRRFVTV